MIFSDRAYIGQPRPFGFAKHVLLICWVHEEDRKFRVKSLRELLQAVIHDSNVSGGHIYEEFYREVTNGGISPQHIHRAIIRDLKVNSEGDVKNVTSSLFQTITWIRAKPWSSTFPMNTPLEREVLFATLAACRTRLCMKDGWDYASCRDDFLLVLEYVMSVFQQH